MQEEKDAGEEDSNAGYGRKTRAPRAGPLHGSAHGAPGEVGARHSGRFILGVARRLQRGYRTQIRADKRRYFEAIGEEAEQAAERNDTRRIYELQRRIAPRPPKPPPMLKDRQGLCITDPDERPARWLEHYTELYLDLSISREELLALRSGPGTGSSIVRAQLDAFRERVEHFLSLQGLRETRLNLQDE